MANKISTNLLVYLAAGIIIVIAATLNHLPFLTGVFRSTSDFQFLGVAHHVQDYYYYLSQFTQGQKSWFMSRDLLTAESIDPTIIGWTNVFLGRVFSLVGISHLSAYQMSVMIFTLIFLVIVFIYLRQILTTKQNAIVALLLFVTTNGLPRLDNFPNTHRIEYIDYWFNLGNPLTRIGFVPHHLLVNISILVTFLAVTKWLQKPHGLLIVLFILSSLILSSVNPVQWFVVFFVMCFVLSFNIIVKKNQFLEIIPAIVFFIIGLPLIIYLYQLFQEPPYSQLKVWESTKHLWLSIDTFIYSYGIVGVIGIFGIMSWGKNTSISSKLLFSYGLLSFTVSNSFLPLWLSISNVRFLSSISVLCLAVSTTFFIDRISGDNLKTKTRVMLILITLSVVLFIPAFIYQLRERTKDVYPVNAFYYLPLYAQEIFHTSNQLSFPLDTFLVVSPFNVSFSATTGRKQFYGHPLLTIDASTKERLASEFFNNQLTRAQVQSLLSEHSIDYIISFPWLMPTSNLFEKISDHSSFTLYKVRNK